MRVPVLVIGGAGYIGSHVVRQLMLDRQDVVVLDNLSRGTLIGSPGVMLYVGDVSDQSLLNEVVDRHGVSTIIHCAMDIDCSQELGAYQIDQDAAESASRMLEGCIGAGVSKIVFTSSCAVYGTTFDVGAVAESHPARPFNRYGLQKLSFEEALMDLSRRGRFTCVVLRCFNVAGVHRGDYRLGASGSPSRLINMSCQVAAGRRPHVPIHGAGFSTSDGTCVRDYAHVEDVAEAHVRAVRYLERGGESVILNCGRGVGASVREVVRAVEREAGVPVPTETLVGMHLEVPSMVANIAAIREKLGWVPRHESLESIIRSVLDFERGSRVHR